MDYHYSKKDFKIDWFSGTGAGGQYRNKHQNCCRITHIESGLQSISTDRERTTNLRNAFLNLTEKILNWIKKKDIDNGSSSLPKEVIRNYNEPRNEVYDKSSGMKLPYKDVVIDGNLEPMIKARQISESIKCK